MSKRQFKLIALLLALTVAITLFSACGQSGKNAPESSASQTATTVAQTTGTTQNGPEELALPIVNQPLTLTVFSYLNANVAATMQNYNDVKGYQELEKRTGIHIEFKQPPVGQEKEQFQLMVASNDLTDMINFYWPEYPGGPDKAVQDGVAIKLNDDIAKYAPNISRLLAEKPEVRKEITTDSGAITAFPELTTDPVTRVFYGAMIRKDWLDKLNLKTPETVDDWYNVLKAFKANEPGGKGKTIPLTAWKGWDQPYDAIPGPSSFIAGAYGITLNNANGLCLDKDGKVIFVPMQAAYKDYLATMQKWFKEGLIDPDYSVSDKKTFDAKITSGVAGAWTGWVGSTMGNDTPVLQKAIPTAQIVAAPHPVLNAGDTPIVGQMSFNSTGNGYAISSKCKNVKEAIKWLDYLYSEDGSRLGNWGIEGESYVMKDGKPQFTDLVLKNPDGLPFFQAIAKYSLAQCGPAMDKDRDAFLSGYPLQTQQDALQIWAKAENKILLPPIALTPEESSATNTIITNINTYVAEMDAKFIMGVEPLENFDKYVETIKSMKIEEFLKVNQAALDRFNSKK